MMGWVFMYMASVVLVNWGFATFPGFEWFWSLVVGTVFITRDYCQRAIGHWCLAAMLAAGAVSWFMADPFIAVASVCAFAVAEVVDWLVFTVLRRPLADRILISSAASTPLDSLVFLGMIGALTPGLLALQIVSKMAAAVAIYVMIRWRA